MGMVYYSKCLFLTFKSMTALLISLSSYGDFALLALRIAVGAIFLVHGKGKRGMWKARPSEQMPAGMLNLMRFLSIAETLGGLAVLAGFLTPLAALGLGVIMLGAIKMKIVKWKMPFTAMDKVGWEFDLILLAACAVLLVLGGGVFSLDALWF